MRRLLLVALLVVGCAPQPAPSPSPSPTVAPTPAPTPTPDPTPGPVCVEVDADVWTETLLVDDQMADAVAVALVETKTPCEVAAKLGNAVVTGNSVFVQRPDGLWEEYNPTFQGVWAKADE